MGFDFWTLCHNGQSCWDEGSVANRGSGAEKVCLGRVAHFLHRLVQPFYVVSAGTQTNFPEAVDRSTCYPFGNRGLAGCVRGHSKGCSSIHYWVSTC